MQQNSCLEFFEIPINWKHNVKVNTFHFKWYLRHNSYDTNVSNAVQKPRKHFTNLKPTLMYNQLLYLSYVCQRQSTIWANFMVQSIATELDRDAVTYRFNLYSTCDKIQIKYFFVMEKLQTTICLGKLQTRTVSSLAKNTLNLITWCQVRNYHITEYILLKRKNFNKQKGDIHNIRLCLVKQMFMIREETF